MKRGSSDGTRPAWQTRGLYLWIAVAVGAGGCGASPAPVADHLPTTTSVMTPTTTERVDVPAAQRPTTSTTASTTTTLPPTTTTTVPPTTTAPPTTMPPPPPTRAATTTTRPPVVVPTTTTSGNCNPNYTPCVPNASDVDCAGGSGNGPAYVSGPVQVIGVDVYGLDRDGDGVGCE